MKSRMTAQQLADLKKSGETGGHLRNLARAANGHGPNSTGVTRQEREKAQAELEKTVGRRRANQLKESALQAAGAKPKGVIGRLLG
ncbi:hypothetical protein ACWEPC_01950 [Nonomuraea sp. NPDC004297]